MLVTLVVVLVYVVVVVSSSSSPPPPPSSSGSSSKIVMVIIVIVVLDVAVVEVVAVTERKPCTTKIQQRHCPYFRQVSGASVLGGFCPWGFVLRSLFYVAFVLLLWGPLSVHSRNKRTFFDK